MQQTSEQIIAAIRAASGVLPIAARNLSCTVENILDHPSPDVQAAIDGEQQKADGEQKTITPKRVQYSRNGDRLSRTGTHYSTPEEMRNKVMFCYKLLTRIPPRTDYQIKAAYRTEFEERYREQMNDPQAKISPYTIADHIASARRLIIINAAEYKDEMRAWLFQRFHQVMLDEEADAQPARGVIVQALNSVATMLGLNAPTKVSIGALTEEDAKKMTPEEALAYAKANGLI